MATLIPLKSSGRTVVHGTMTRMISRELEFFSHPGNLSLVRQFVRSFLQDIGSEDGLIELMVLGIDEACTNIIRYAYRNADNELIRLKIEFGDDIIRCRLRDYGASPDPAKLTGRPLEVVKPGGLGLHLIRQAFDDAFYRRRPRGTELVLIKSVGNDVHMAHPDDQPSRAA